MRKRRLWTLEQFTTIAGKPRYVLEEHCDDGQHLLRPSGGVKRQFTGYREELLELAARMGVSPEEGPGITEQEFFRRWLAACFSRRPCSRSVTTKEELFARFPGRSAQTQAGVCP